MMAQYPDVFIMTFSIHIPNFVLLSQSAQLLLIFCYAAPLQVIGSVFDPLGYYSPTVLRAKLLMKMLWKEGCEWDTKLDTEKLTKWLEILEDPKLYLDSRMKANTLPT